MSAVGARLRVAKMVVRRDSPVVSPRFDGEIRAILVGTQFAGWRACSIDVATRYVWRSSITPG